MYYTFFDLWGLRVGQKLDTVTDFSTTKQKICSFSCKITKKIIDNLRKHGETN